MILYTRRYNSRHGICTLYKYNNIIKMNTHDKVFKYIIIIYEVGGNNAIRRLKSVANV